MSVAETQIESLLVASASEATSTPLDFFNLEVDEAIVKLGEIAGKKFHGSSFVSFVYKHKITNPLLMTSIPAAVREKMKDSVVIKGLPVKKRLVSKDGTVKFLLEVQTPKGPDEIECVYLPDPERVTLCVSSQVGCKMGCKFCLTAQLGWKGNLSAGDIVKQIFTVEQDPELRPITNIVFMGMGEPFDNFEEVKKATRILTDSRAFEKSGRKITVSTVGHVDKIDALKKEDPFKLAVSLNASNDKTRSEIMPINKRYNIQELMRACRDYAERTNKKVTFEYILMSGLSDSVEDAKRLVQLLRGIPCKINLIPYNESKFTDFKRPSDERISNFHSFLVDRGFAAFTRKNRGNDIFAACGMLKKENPDFKEPKIA